MSTTTEEMTPEDRKMLQEELGATKLESEDTVVETNDKLEDVKLTLPEEEGPIPKDETNPYIKLLGDVFTENQKEQNERAQEIINSQKYEVKLTAGGTEELKYHELNRKQDVDVRAAQRKYFKIKSLVDDLRKSYLPETITKEDGTVIPNKDYKPFDIKQFVTSPFLKGKITAESSREEIGEVLDDISDEHFQHRFLTFAEAFFGLTTDEQIDRYVYKDLTFMLDIAYSSYSTVPY